MGSMTGEELYNIYRAIRVKQGWEEWKWESLNASQQLVWNHLAGAVAQKLFRSVAFPRESGF